MVALEENVSVQMSYSVVQKPVISIHTGGEGLSGLYTG